MDLRQREAGDTDMKELMAVAHKITLPWKAALQHRNREEEGGAEGQRHLAEVIDSDGVMAVCGEHQSSGDGTHVPDKSQHRWNQLARLMQQSWAVMVAVFSVATTQA